MCASDHKIGKSGASQETGNHTGSWGSSELSLAIKSQQWSHSSHGYYAAHRYNPQEILYQVQPSIRKPKQSHPPYGAHTVSGLRQRGQMSRNYWLKENKTFILGCVPLKRQLIYVQGKMVVLVIHAFSFPLQITLAQSANGTDNRHKSRPLSVGFFLYCNMSPLWKSPFSPMTFSSEPSCVTPSHKLTDQSCHFELLIPLWLSTQTLFYAAKNHNWTVEFDPCALVDRQGGKLLKTSVTANTFSHIIQTNKMCHGNSNKQSISNLYSPTLCR